MRIKHLLNTAIAVAVVSFAIAGCNSSGSDDEQATDATAPAQQTVYEATLQPINAAVTGSSTTGKARFVVDGENMTVTIDIENAPAGIEHWQHFHGFENGEDARVVDDSADKNGDGVIDVTETGPYSGTTMVPFNDLPAKMDVGSDTYPKADENGSYHYSATIPMADLQKAFADAFGGTELQLDKRVLYIHGVPSDTKLASTVASIADIPASVTLPIASGKIEKVD